MSPRIAINREEEIDAIVRDLKELDNRQLPMVSDYIRGLKAAKKYLDMGWRPNNPV
jgi:hypothetical protein